MGGPTNIPRLLNKGLFRSVRSSPPSYYYSLNSTNFPPPPVPSILPHLFHESSIFHEYCRDEYPDGTDANNLPPSALSTLITQASSAPTFSPTTFFEATLTHSELLCRVDILHLTSPTSLSLIEVKSKSHSSSSPKIFTKAGKIAAPYKPYVDDVAFQYNIAHRAFPNHTVTPFLLLPDKSKTIAADAEIATLIDLSNHVPGLVADPSFTDTIDACLQLLSSSMYTDNVDPATGSKRPPPTTPERDLIHYFTGHNLDIPLPHPLPETTDPLVTTLRGSRVTKISAYLKRRQFFLKDLSHPQDYDTPSDLSKGKGFPPTGFTSADLIHFQVQHAKSAGPPHHLNARYLAPALASLTFPLHFLDFETAQPAVPLTPSQRPYETIPFQFSHHVLHEDGRLEHGEFIEMTGEDPTAAFAEALAEALGNGAGSVVHWGAYERTILNKLGAFDGHNVFERLVDLSVFVKKGWYGGGMKGSNSLKHVLQSAVNESDALRRIYCEEYDGSNFDKFVWWREGPDGAVVDPYMLLATDEGVTDGAGAAAAYLAVRRGEMDEGEGADMLKMYCELDTLGMVMVYQALVGFVEQEQQGEVELEQ